MDLSVRSVQNSLNFQPSWYQPTCNLHACSNMRFLLFIGPVTCKLHQRIVFHVSCKEKKLTDHCIGKQIPMYRVSRSVRARGLELSPEGPRPWPPWRDPFGPISPIAEGRRRMRNDLQQWGKAESRLEPIILDWAPRARVHGISSWVIIHTAQTRDKKCNVRRRVLTWMVAITWIATDSSTMVVECHAYALTDHRLFHPKPNGFLR